MFEHVATRQDVGRKATPSTVKVTILAGPPVSITNATGGNPVCAAATHVPTF
jgi:hypothetical protein